MSTLKIKGDINVMKEIVSANEKTRESLLRAAAQMNEFYPEDPEVQCMLRDIEAIQKIKMRLLMHVNKLSLHTHLTKLKNP